MRNAHALAALVFVVGAAFATDALADPSEKEQKYGYEFKDDLLTAKDLAGHTAQIHIAKAARRDMLLRPRVQFVSEMLKSVENL